MVFKPYLVLIRMVVEGTEKMNIEHPPAAPVKVLVIIIASEKKNKAQIEDRVSRTRAGRSNAQLAKGEQVRPRRIRLRIEH